tara:strand:- start:277 stop:474 length:198 start_codon:yes stop_codon:yes gene_type:complete
MGIEICFGASFSVVIIRSPSKSSIWLGKIESNGIDSSLKILDSLKYGLPYSVAIPIFAFSIRVML